MNEKGFNDDALEKHLLIAIVLSKKKPLKQKKKNVKYVIEVNSSFII